MLRVIGVVTCTFSVVEVDPYIPLDLKFDGEAPEDKLYWRMKDGDMSLLEVAVSSKDGRVISVTLTSMDPVKVSRAKLESTSGQIVTGVPRIDLDLWPRSRIEFGDNFVDEQGELTLILDGRNAVIFLDDVNPIQSWFSTPKVRFGITADGNLACVEIVLDPIQEKLLLKLVNGQS